MMYKSKILIIDDDEGQIFLLQDILEKDYRVYSTKKSESAILKVKEILPDIILLDRMMPGIAGEEICRKLKEDSNFNQIKIILVSARATTEDKCVGLEFGADDYITKPFADIELLARVKNQLRTAQIESELRNYKDNLEKMVDLRTLQLKESESALKKTLNEKILLIQEIHHRVKNNLQIISSLINLEAKEVSNNKCDKKCAHEKLLECSSRIRSMATIHEKLYSSIDYSQINFSDYIKTFGDYLLNLNNTSSEIKLDIKTETLFLTIEKAIPLGLIINEILMHFIKNGYKDKKEGTISLVLEKSILRNYFLRLKNDGDQKASVIDEKSLSFSIIEACIKQIKGKLHFFEENGFVAEIIF